MSIQDDLITLIDAADYAASVIRNDWQDPRIEVRAIWDCHDLAHVLTGGDGHRRPWRFLSDLFYYPDGAGATSYSDVRERVLALLEREVRP